MIRPHQLLSARMSNVFTQFFFSIQLLCVGESWLNRKSLPGVMAGSKSTGPAAKWRNQNFHLLLTWWMKKSCVPSFNVIIRAMFGIQCLETHRKSHPWDWRVLLYVCVSSFRQRKIFHQLEHRERYFWYNWTDLSTWNNWQICYQ